MSRPEDNLTRVYTINLGKPWIWSRGKTNPPRRVRVRMVKDEDETVVVSLYEEAVKETEDSTTSKDVHRDND